MNSIETARNHRLKFQKIIEQRGFTKEEAIFLTGIEIRDKRISYLLPYGVFDPGRMGREQFDELLAKFPDLEPEYQAFIERTRQNNKFAIQSALVENVPVPITETEAVVKLIFERWPSVYEIK